MQLIQQTRKQTRLSRSTHHAHVDVRPPLQGPRESVIKSGATTCRQDLLIRCCDMFTYIREE